MIALEDLDDNFNSLLYAIFKNVSCDVAWTEITGESIGYKPLRVEIANRKALKNEVIKLRKTGLIYKQISKELYISASAACTMYLEYARVNDEPVGRIQKKLSFEDKKKILELRKTLSLRRIAKIYNTTATTIQAIEKSLLKEITKS